MEKFKLYFIDVLKNKYVQFSGRARREEYWYFALFCFILSIPIYFIHESLDWVLSLLTLCPSLALTVRRLHDTNRSGWYYFIVLIPIVGAILLLIWLCKEGTHGANEYGEDPKA